ncbi:hypothetical protein J437_LFUL015212 [Ladona fulva]|uniref:Uncharacterized protein n=1 Tax=Ladona fulva TaxID=123851 RepID=A0A8K0P8C0_LADFU|nr:hypothetical protein J437_LFUL015212 [Ladona fulva]
MPCTRRLWEQPIGLSPWVSFNPRPTQDKRDSDLRRIYFEEREDDERSERGLEESEERHKAEEEDPEEEEGNFDDLEREEQDSEEDDVQFGGETSGSVSAPTGYSDRTEDSDEEGSSEERYRGSRGVRQEIGFDSEPGERSTDPDDHQCFICGLPFANSDL